MEETVFYFEPATFVNHISAARRYASRTLRNLLSQSSDDPTDTWGRIRPREPFTIAPYRPGAMLKHFPGVKMKPGWGLSAYQYYDGSNGNGFVFAVRHGKSLPAPAIDMSFLWTKEGFAFPYSGNKLPDWLSPAFERFMETDGSPRSYLMFSLMFREMRELGAVWHGCNWSTHKVISNPTEYRHQGWKWLSEVPESLLPRVILRPSGVVVVEFYSHSELGQAAIYKHEDRYENCSFVSTESTVIADGGPGYIF